MQDEQYISTVDAADAFAGIGDMGVEAPDFRTVDGYTTFRVEHADIDGDLVFHFYATDEINGLADPWAYWKRTFPAELERVAMGYFNATAPRLRAAYADELASWWLRADGFDHVLDSDAYVARFIELLDQALDPHVRTS